MVWSIFTCQLLHILHKRFSTLNICKRNPLKELLTSWYLRVVPKWFCLVAGHLLHKIFPVNWTLSTFFGLSLNRMLTSLFSLRSSPMMTWWEPPMVRIMEPCKRTFRHLPHSRAKLPCFILELLDIRLAFCFISSLSMARFCTCDVECTRRWKKRCSIVIRHGSVHSNIENNISKSHWNNYDKNTKQYACITFFKEN